MLLKIIVKVHNCFGWINRSRLVGVSVPLSVRLSEAFSVQPRSQQLPHQFWLNFADSEYVHFIFWSQFIEYH